MQWSKVHIKKVCASIGRSPNVPFDSKDYFTEQNVILLYIKRASIFLLCTLTKARVLHLTEDWRWRQQYFWQAPRNLFAAEVLSKVILSAARLQHRLWAAAPVSAVGQCVFRHETFSPPWFWWYNVHLFLLNSERDLFLLFSSATTKVAYVSVSKSKQLTWTRCPLGLNEA